jgi:uracil-DNA glycosylase
MKLKIIPNLENITNEMTIYEVAKKYCPPSWENVFDKAKNELEAISEILEEDKKNGRRLPDNIDLFRAFWNTKLNNVKVVIIGKDPYFSILQNGKPQAMGMSFSVRKNSPIPSGLRNIYKEIEQSISNFKMPNHGDLTQWAEQGVLLLNACLTVREKEPGSHKEVWLGFVKKVVNSILDVNSKCIFVAWGKNAQKITKKFINERATVLESGHPSALSTNRGFFGNKHFPTINKLLIERNKKPIDWNIY